MARCRIWNTRCVVTSMNDPAPASCPDGRSWTALQSVTDHAALDPATDWLLGYPFVFRALSLDTFGAGRLLDFGCGPARVAAHAARRFAIQVTAADVFEHMLRLARANNAPGVEVRAIRDGRVEDLPDGCMDAAMCNHVLGCLPTRHAMAGALREIHRLLKPGARLAVLSSDPSASGIDFDSVRIGEHGVSYRVGDELPIRLKQRDGTWAAYTDYYRSADDYPTLLADAGFHTIGQHRPTVDDAARVADPALVSSRPWTAERDTPPLLLTTTHACTRHTR